MSRRKPKTAPRTGDGPAAHVSPGYGSWARFVLLFAAIFIAGTKAHQLTRARTARFLVGTLTVKPSAMLINLFTPSESTQTVGNLLKGNVTIQVKQGCEGLDCLLLLIAAVLAFPAAWKAKLVALGVGIPLIYVCNLVRIAALYYVQRYTPDFFELMHVYVGQTFVILVGAGFFLFWVRHLAQTT